MRRLDPTTAALGALAPFRSCTRRELERVQRLLTPLRFEPGHAFVEEGHTGREAFVLGAGTALVSECGRPLAELTAGDVVGELALLDGRTRAATVTATTEGMAYVMSIPEFRRLLDEAPSVGRTLLAVLLLWLRAADELAVAVPGVCVTDAGVRARDR